MASALAFSLLFQRALLRIQVYHLVPVPVPVPLSVSALVLVLVLVLELAPLVQTLARTPILARLTTARQVARLRKPFNQWSAQYLERPTLMTPGRPGV